MGIPQIILIVLMAVSLGITIAKDGTDREPYNAWQSVISIVIMVLLLWWGGFFTPCN